MAISTGSIARSVVLALAFTTGAPAAKAGADEGGLTLNYALASQYLFRGISQTSGHSTVQGGLEYASDAGPYVGTWASNISWFDDLAPGNHLPVEWDIDAGFRRPLAAANLDVGVVRYLYPGHLDALPAGIVRPDMTEAYASIAWHALVLKYSLSLTNSSGLEGSRGSQYVELALAVPLGRWLRGGAHVGRAAFRGHSAWTDQSGTDNAHLYSYTDASLTLAGQLPMGWEASLAASVATTSDAGYLCASGNPGGQRIVLSFQRSF